MNVHTLRITRAYEDIKDVIMDWIKVSGKLLVYQHDADDEVAQTHVHLLIEECALGIEGLKKRVKHKGFNGNKDWSFTKPDIDKENYNEYIAYMSKGHYDPVYNHNYDMTYLETCKNKWVEHKKKEHAPKEHVDKKETILIQQWIEYRDYCMNRPLNDHMQLTDFRGMSINYWKTKNKGLMPTASTYKRFLVSVYIYYCDTHRKPMSEQVIDEIDQRM